MFFVIFVVTSLHLAFWAGYKVNRFSMKERKVALSSSIVSGAGSITALFTSLCCAGPSVIALIGAGGAAAAAGLAPFRPYLLTGSLIFLAIGFWRVYRPATAQGQSCSIHAGKSLKAILWGSFVLWLASLILFVAPKASALLEPKAAVSSHVSIGPGASELRGAFNADLGKVRVIMLVAPT